MFHKRNLFSLVCFAVKWINFSWIILKCQQKQHMLSHSHKLFWARPMIFIDILRSIERLKDIESAIIGSNDTTWYWWWFFLDFFLLLEFINNACNCEPYQCHIVFYHIRCSISLFDANFCLNFTTWYYDFRCSHFFTCPLSLHISIYSPFFCSIDSFFPFFGRSINIRISQTPIDSDIAFIRVINWWAKGN